MTIAARSVAVFKPSKELATRVNGAESAESTDGIPEAQPSDGSAKLHGDKINI